MTPYADTNFFTAALASVEHTAKALALMEKLRVTRGPALPVTPLVRMELTNALLRLVHEARHGNQGIRATPEQMLLAEHTFLEELERGIVWEKSSLSLDALESRFDDIAHRQTARHGFRTYDILHVASAFVLGCDTFWSFDLKAQKLAKLEGLRTN